METKVGLDHDLYYGVGGIKPHLNLGRAGLANRSHPL